MNGMSRSEEIRAIAIQAAARIFAGRPTLTLDTKDFIRFADELKNYIITGHTR